MLCGGGGHEWNRQKYYAEKVHYPSLWLVLDPFTDVKIVLHDRMPIDLGFLLWIKDFSESRRDPRSVVSQSRQNRCLQEIVSTFSGPPALFQRTLTFIIFQPSSAAPLRHPTQHHVLYIRYFR